MRTHYRPWQPCWISNQHQKHKSGRGPSSEHFWQVWLSLDIFDPLVVVVTFSIPLSLLANVQNASRYETYKIIFVRFHVFIFCLCFLFLSHNSIDLVVSDKKIFKISANENTLWALAAMLDFKSAPKTQIW
jgi:hypothetical protein